MAFGTLFFVARGQGNAESSGNRGKKMEAWTGIEPV